MSRKTRTYKGSLKRAKKVAEDLRKKGWRVTVFYTRQGRTGRIQVEVRPPSDAGASRVKITKIFQKEQDAAVFLGGLLSRNPAIGAEQGSAGSVSM